MIQTKSIRLFIAALPFIPLILLMIPKAFVVMPEPGEFIPWYTKYTEVPWLLTAFYLYPTARIASLVGFRVLGPVHVVLMLAYAAGISLLLRGTMTTGFRQVFRRQA
jgi:hypothetical protein